MPDVSIIVCTCARPARLMDCLHSIAEAVAFAGDEGVETIVVENGSPESMQLDEAEVRRAGGCLTRLAGGGLAAARNAGMRTARGRLLVFTDDDCLMARHYLRDLRAYAGETDGHLFIGGRVSLADPTDLKFTVKDMPVREVFREHIHPGGFLMGCNMVIARKTALKIGAFDTRFGAGSPLKAGEDTDYIIRAHLTGIRVEYVPGMDIYHRHGRKRVGQIRELNRQYAYANGAIYAKHFFKAPWLKRHLYWTARAAARERFLGGPGFDERFGLGWGSLLGSHLLGFAGYVGQMFAAPRTISRRAQA